VNRRPIWLQMIMFVFLVALGAGARIASKEFQTWNFTPLAAVTLFAGFYFGSVFVAAIVPVAVMMLSNFYLYGKQEWLGYGYWQMMAVVYAALMIPLLFRWLLRGRRTAPGLLFSALGSALLSALLFYAATNFAHWWYQATPHTQETLLKNYVDALPFLRGTVIGDLVFTTILFGGYALAAHFAPAGETAALRQGRRIRLAVFQRRAVARQHAEKKDEP
jgi:hypothetical protein